MNGTVCASDAGQVSSPRDRAASIVCLAGWAGMHQCRVQRHAQYAQLGRRRVLQVAERVKIAQLGGSAMMPKGTVASCALLGSFQTSQGQVVAFLARQAASASLEVQSVIHVQRAVIRTKMAQAVVCFAPMGQLVLTKAQWSPRMQTATSAWGVDWIQSTISLFAITVQADVWQARVVR